MKRLIVIVPAILMAVFLFYSFVQKEKDAFKVTGNKSGPVNTFLKSTDGGQTWQDISSGLPENLPEDSIQRNSFFANDEGLFLKVGNGLYHSSSNAIAPFWTTAILPGSKPRDFGQQVSNTPGTSGIAVDKYWRMNLKKANETSVWSPMFEVSEMPRIGTNFETASGTIFIGTNKGYYKTDNDGKTWKHVYAGGAVGHLAESNGVLLAISHRRMIRSTDNGENWELLNSDTSFVFDVKQIKGGFAAMTATSVSNPRGIKTSYDAGKTWQPNNAANKVFIDSIWRTWNTRPSVKAFSTGITQLGENLFSSHPKGIYRSSDKGKTWKLILPAVKDKVSILLSSGNVMYLVYAIPGKGGC